MDDHTGSGVEWLVDASGCEAAALGDPVRLVEALRRVVRELELRPVAQPLVHVFPPPGGVTAVLVLSESHLTCHTFPETGEAAFNLYCCRERPEWPWQERLAEILGAKRVLVRRLRRLSEAS
ncbi:MAG: S-adenosylmethionine decarboxylase family protein [Myxococcales bacterium]